MTRKPAGKTPAQPAPSAPRYPSVAEAYKQAVAMQGERIGVDEIIGERVVFHRYFKRRSKYATPSGAEDYVSVQIERMQPKEMRYVNTSSRSVADRLDRISEHLPREGAFIRKTSATGRAYYTIE